MEDKNKRYDRQLRLWGDHGQAALEAARVCLLNATATGTEILKNLVLPGIGSFTIVDPAKVTASDLGVNFFVSRKYLGASRAQCCMEYLQKHNKVKGDYIEEELDVVLDSNPNFLCQFTIVIATSLPEVTVCRISKTLWTSSVPLIVARIYGLIGYIRIATPSHQIIESHPDNSREDLRLDCPFDGLSEYMDSMDLSKVNDSEHSNIPYLVIMYKCLQEWRNSHSGELPKTYRDKVALKERIKAGIRVNDSGVPLEEENFDEAVKNVNRDVFEYQVPASVQKVLEECVSTQQPTKFWLQVRALKEFVANEGEGKLPLRGSIPDMTSNSKLYIDLSKVYQVKAQEDMEAFRNHLGNILVSLGKPVNYISDEEIRRFCRNSQFLLDTKYRSIEDELQQPDRATLMENLENSGSDIMYYILLRGAEKFFEMYHFYPGNGEGDGIETDSMKLRSIVMSLLQKWQVTYGHIDDDHISEFCRYGAGEIHSVASFVGGVASQEVIKIITHQFIPLNNTWIYNAATQTTLTVSL